MGERTYVSVPELFPEFTQDELIGSEGMGFGMGLVLLHANIDTLRYEHDPPPGSDFMMERYPHMSFREPCSLILHQYSIFDIFPVWIGR